MWLAVIDIDHFKRVNDVYGHLIGDEVLLLLSRLMRSSFRFHDHLYRFGGEEFVVLMRCDDAEAAAGVLERLRQAVAAYRFPQVERITVSVGFTALRAPDTPSAAFERADLALYHVKQNGRDGVAGHARLVAQGHLQDRALDNDVELF
jgi:diguanylate cyclase (GGDEF)-like protein